MLLLPRQRIPHKSVFYYRCPDHQRNYVLSFAFAFDREDDVYQVTCLFYIVWEVCCLPAVDLNDSTELFDPQ